MAVAGTGVDVGGAGVKVAVGTSVRVGVGVNVAVRTGVRVGVGVRVWVAVGPVARRRTPRSAAESPRAARAVHKGQVVVLRERAAPRPPSWAETA